MTAKTRSNQTAVSPLDPAGGRQGKSELEMAFEARGPAAIATVRRLDPGAYIKAIARMVRGLPDD
jgi:hypothetical protein